MPLPPADLQIRIREQFDDLPGVEVMAFERWSNGDCAIRVQQRFGPSTVDPDKRTLVGLVNLTNLRSAPAFVGWNDIPTVVGQILDPVFRPWRYPDRSPMPNLDQTVAPRTTRLVDAFRSYRP